jgi:hypothetical protein
MFVSEFKLKNKVLLAGIIVLIANCAYAQQESPLSSRLKLQDASAVSRKANDTQSHNGSIMSNPLYNAITNGVGNFMQGMGDNPTNSYSMQEQRRQQVEYLKQGK